MTAARTAADRGDAARLVRLRVSGMTCVACSNRVERALRRVDPSVSASVDFVTGTATVTAGPTVPDADLAAAVVGAGYGVAAGTRLPPEPREV
ncbi:heavy metal-associated domain-containing protein, partial [Tsukamurella soli]|uniref:heavy-metal-associated domain-containing protein n=1 Tax=Tsukamurella soli TaxID=644556 RepID=UPI0031EF9336